MNTLVIHILYSVNSCKITHYLDSFGIHKTISEQNFVDRKNIIIRKVYLTSKDLEKIRQAVGY